MPLKNLLHVLPSSFFRGSAAIFRYRIFSRSFLTTT